MSVKFIIGIDGGGTKTIGRIENITTGETIDQHGGSSSLTNDFEGACVTLMQIIESLMAKSEAKANEICVVMGLAGAGNQSQVKRLKRRLSFPFASLEIFNDARTSLFGANQGQPAAMVALGTGSVGAMLDSESKEHYFGGWGFPIGDEGGGAKLGFYTVQEVIADIEENPYAYALTTKHILGKLGSERDDLLNWLRISTPADYATLCKDIFALAGDCDVARKIIAKHTHHVEQLITQTRQGSDIPVILMGGLAEPTMPFINPEIAKFCKVQLGSSLEGACWLAKQKVSSISAEDEAQAKEDKTEIESKQQALLSELNSMVSEERNPDTMNIDLMTSGEILSAMNTADKNVPLAVEKCLPEITQAVDAIVESFGKGGRLVYIGAGTSGRLGILDAVECPPTFSVSSKQVVGIIAGGNQAIYKAVEGAEDDPILGQQDLEQINFNENDVLVGIAASGRTPYVIGALDYAKTFGVTTISVTCNPNSIVAKHSDINICPVVGPEVLTGSTRLKSGTAQKLVLNMLTTASMIRSGKSYENLMVDVNASNKKLYARAIRIVMQATKCDRITAENALEQTEFNAKLAILHVLTGVNPELGINVLNNNNGFLRSSIAELSS